MENKKVRLIDLIDDMCAGKDLFFRFVCVARDIMAKNLKTLTMDDSLEKCLKFMQDHKIRHVPIIDTAIKKHGKPRFVGVISDRDLIRQISPYVGKIGEQETDQKALRQCLGQLITGNPISISPETPIPEILTCLLDNHIDMVPVVSDGDLVSIVTATDIIKLFVRLDSIRQLSSKSSKSKTRRLPDLLAGDSPELVEVFSSILRTVQNIMTEQVVALGGRDTVAKAIEIMQDGEFRHIPVVDEQGTVKGIVSDRDVLLYLPFVGGQRVLQSQEFCNTMFEVNPKHPSLRLPLKQIMASDPITISLDTSLYEVAKKLYELRINSLIVTDEEKKLLGIVTVSDVMKGLLAAYRLVEKSHPQPSASEVSVQEPASVSG
ncbi:MAG: CBS domain-containing protein [Planctomycetota bacterium]|jgi:acetoin utilization protein AcuB